MSAKHFLHDPTRLVLDSLESNTITNPSLAFDRDHKIIYRRTISKEHGKVSIISGGGSGHEPGFAGYVGKGLLTASVAGTIFASPSTQQIRQAFERVPVSSGVLVLIMNYTGDVLNFGMAVENARANGVDAEFFAIGDDVGVGRQRSGKVGRRGLAGSGLVMKLCGSLAELGGSLTEVYNLAKQVAGNIVTVGASLDHVHVPGRAISSTADSELKSQEIEIGMGIHNEPGSGRVSASLPDLVKMMLKQLLDRNEPDRHYIDLEPNDKVVLLVNNLGGVSILELGAITKEVCSQLSSDYNLSPVRVLSGPFLTSLNGPGFSVTLLKLAETGLGDGKSMLDLLDFPTEAVGWPAPLPSTTWELATSAPTTSEPSKSDSVKPSQLTLDPSVARKILESGLSRLITAEPEVTRFDTIVGDGDCGIGMKRGAEAVLHALSESSNQPTDAVVFANKIKAVVESVTDGTSGALLTILLSGLVRGLRECDSGASKPATIDVWGKALGFALTTLAKYTPARPGDRTLMDSLVPFVEVLASTSDVKKAAEAAQAGAEKTKDMKASLGRAMYVGTESEWIGKIPDPGAWALSEFFQGLAEAC